VPSVSFFVAASPILLRIVDSTQVERIGSGMIVTTSALGTGVDFPGIVYIVLMETPWSMIDYTQESGRESRFGGIGGIVRWRGR
jgi:superfamily II DNA or RNA helicase